MLKFQCPVPKSIKALRGSFLSFDFCVDMVLSNWHLLYVSLYMSGTWCRSLAIYTGKMSHFPTSSTTYSVASHKHLKKIYRFNLNEQNFNINTNCSALSVLGFHCCRWHRTVMFCWLMKMMSTFQSNLPRCPSSWNRRTSWTQRSPKHVWMSFPIWAR